jgi:hypothetical protein
MAIAAVGIVTCDRPADLNECLCGYVENARRYGRALEFVVVDDSRSIRVQELNRLTCAAVTDRFGAAVRYAGRREKGRFAEALNAAAGVPADVIRFALLGDDRCAVSIGANRNGLLLDTIGALTFSADDDTRCRSAAVSGSGGAPSACTSYDPTEFWFFPARAAVLDPARFAAADFLSDHDALLGHAVPDVAASGDAVARIGITMQGLAGDSGMGSARYYLALTGASRERLVASAEAYRSALRSRAVLRAAPRTAICAGSFFMSTFFGSTTDRCCRRFFPSNATPMASSVSRTNDAFRTDAWHFCRGRWFMRPRIHASSRSTRCGTTRTAYGWPTS